MNPISDQGHVQKPRRRIVKPTAQAVARPIRPIRPAGPTRQATQQAPLAAARKPHQPAAPEPPHETTAIRQLSPRPGPRPEARTKIGITIPEFVLRITHKVVPEVVVGVIQVMTHETTPETTVGATCETTTETTPATTRETYL